MRLQVGRLDVLHNVPLLQELVVRFNVLCNVDDLLVLAKQTPALVSLDVRNNAITDGPLAVAHTQRLALAAFSGNRLQTLNGLLVADIDISKATPAHVSNKQRTARCWSGTPVRRPTELWLAHCVPAPVDTGMPEPDFPLEPSVDTVAVCIEDGGHTVGTLLATCPQVRFLCLARNGLPRVPEQLGACRFLEELCLADNALTAVPLLACAATLRRLDLGSNRLSSLAGLGQCPQLQELVVSDNRLMSLDGLASTCPNLTMLFAGLNLLGSLRCVLSLQVLFFTVVFFCHDLMRVLFSFF
jgi:Leucine-rich repeat (LRR) protein